MKISCKCLNVTIESKGSNFDDVDVTTLDIPRSDFFKEALGTVELIGISKEQPFLVEVHSIGSWVVHRCLNCQTYTHALNRDKGAASLLVNKSLITDPELIAELQSSENFSPIFHIIVNYSDDDDVFTKVSGTGAHQSGIAALYQLLSNFIQRETAATEERVRAFTDQQYAALENLRSRAHRDHRSLTKLLAETGQVNSVINRTAFTNVTNSALKNKNVASPGPVVLASASAAIKKPDVHQSSTNKQKIVESSGISIEIGNEEVIDTKMNSAGGGGGSRTHTPGRRLSDTGSHSNLSLDSEVLFPLEGMEDPASDNYHTDEERSDTDDSGSHDEGIHIPRRVNSFVYAKSLPVNVPTFVQKHSEHNESGLMMGREIGGFESIHEPPSEHHRSPRQPMDIAASIKALAKSVHGDAVFGDLPRPRFSSQI